MIFNDISNYIVCEWVCIYVLCVDTKNYFPPPATVSYTQYTQ